MNNSFKRNQKLMHLLMERTS